MAAIDVGAAPAGALETRARRRRAPLLPALVFTIVVTQIPFLFTLSVIHKP